MLLKSTLLKDTLLYNFLLYNVLLNYICIKVRVTSVRLRIVNKSPFLETTVPRVAPAWLLDHPSRSQESRRAITTTLYSWCENAMFPTVCRTLSTNFIKKKR